MAKCRPKLSTVSASDLITVGSFQWSHGHKIGEGSYGKVYLGWSKVCPLEGHIVGTQWAGEWWRTDWGVAKRRLWRSGGCILRT